MRFIVELAISEQDFTERMNTMRAWLDHCRCQPSAFRFAGPEQSICRVHFEAENEATAFASEFGGRLLNAPPIEDVIR
jgi:hypothetical protein